jgi:hypothetical protein
MPALVGSSSSRMLPYLTGLHCGVCSIAHTAP